jgi:uncharacterized protein (DUF2147 family)
MKAMRVCLAVAAFFFGLNASFAGDVLGTWLSDEGALRIRFEPCGDALCGNVVWLKPGSEPESKVKVGQPLFFDMHPDGANSWAGKTAYDGSVYVSKMSVEGTTLSTSGCIMSGVFCKSKSWTRVP